MLVYTNTLIMTQEFNKDLLVELFIKWMERKPRNNVYGVQYTGKDLVVKNDFKEVEFKTFNNEYFGIRYSINLKQNIFSIHILYNIILNKVTFSFFKEIEPSVQGDHKFFANINLPGIFLDLLKSEYTVHNEIKTINVPFFTNYQYVKRMKNRNYTLPLVIIYRKNKGRCIIAPDVFSKPLVGHAYVVVASTEKEDLYDKVHIIYKPNHQECETIDVKRIGSLIDKIKINIRNYLIDHKANLYSFESLVFYMNKETVQKTNIDKEQSISDYQDEIEFYEEELKQLTLQYEELCNENNVLQKQLEKKELNKKIVLVSSNHLYDKKKELVNRVIKTRLHNLINSNEARNYRQTHMLGGIDLDETE